MIPGAVPGRPARNGLPAVPYEPHARRYPHAERALQRAEAVHGTPPADIPRGRPRKDGSPPKARAAPSPEDKPRCDECRYLLARCDCPGGPRGGAR